MTNVADKRQEVESRVKKFISKLEEKHELIEQYKKGIDVLFLSCNEKLRTDAEKLMKEKGYNAITVEDFKPMFKFLPEFEIEKEAIKMAKIVVAVGEDCKKDGVVERCPGFVQECTIIMNTKKYQIKTILIVDEKVEYDKLTNVERLHYLYFPKIYRCPYVDTDSLKELCVKIAIKEVHRRIIMLLNELEQRDLSG